MTPLKNPLPADFREHLHKTVVQQMEMYGKGRHTICRWRRLCGISAYELAWRDEDLAILKEMSAAGYPYSAIAAKIGCGIKRVMNATHRYKLGNGVAKPRIYLRKPVPDDFVEQWATKTLAALATLYGTSENTVRRWVREKRLKRPTKHANLRAVDFTRQAPERTRAIAKPGYMTAPVDRGYKEDSAAGEAQRYLQSLGYRPVVRCDPAGVAKQHGALWICGRTVGLTDRELVAKAGEIRERNFRLYGRAA